MLRIQPEGGTSWHTLWETSHSGPDTTESRNVTEGADPGTVVPDGLGGVLAGWVRYDLNGSHSQVSRLVGGSLSEHAVATPVIDAGTPVVFVSDGGTAFLHYIDESYNPHLDAIDVASWTTKWSQQTWSPPLIALANGHFVLNNNDVSPT